MNEMGVAGEAVSPYAVDLVLLGEVPEDGLAAIDRLVDLISLVRAC